MANSFVDHFNFNNFVSDLLVHLWFHLQEVFDLSHLGRPHLQRRRRLHLHLVFRLLRWHRSHFQLSRKRSSNFGVFGFNHLHSSYHDFDRIRYFLFGLQWSTQTFINHQVGISLYLFLPPRYVKQICWEETSTLTEKYFIKYS